jgi:GcrA cell cycle regulator
VGEVTARRGDLCPSDEVSGKHWTPDEDATIRALWPNTWKISEATGRTVGAAYCRGYVLGLRAPVADKYADKTDVIIAMWREGRTATAIACAVGVKTRSAILGKLHRLGLLGQRGQHKKPAAHHRARNKEATRRYRARLNSKFTRSSPAIVPRVKAGAFVPYTDAPPVLSPLKPYAECVTMEGLKPHHCRFPVDGDGDMRYCGEDKSFKSYCLTHHIHAHRR